MSILNDISENLQRGKAKVVKELVQQAIDQGIPAQQILDEGLLSGMNVVGEKFKNNEVFVPEVLVAARAMNMGASLLKPLLAESGLKASGRVCIGTVKALPWARRAAGRTQISRGMRSLPRKARVFRTLSRPVIDRCPLPTRSCSSAHTASAPGR